MTEFGVIVTRYPCLFVACGSILRNIHPWHAPLVQQVHRRATHDLMRFLTRYRQGSLCSVYLEGFLLSILYIVTSLWHRHPNSSVVVVFHDHQIAKWMKSLYSTYATYLNFPELASCCPSCRDGEYRVATSIEHSNNCECIPIFSIVVSNPKVLLNKFREFPS